MSKNISFSEDHKALIRRYLLWVFKTTKESLERIERKTTQLVIDEYILERVKTPRGVSARDKEQYGKLVKEFEVYIKTKEADELKLKFSDKKKKALNPQYVFLKNRLQAAQEAIKHFLGEKELRRIQNLYENEFTNRILQAREH